MDVSNAYNNIQELLKKHPENIAVLEHEIDIALQIQYFKESKAIKKELDSQEVLGSKDLLFGDEMTLEHKRALLSNLASVNDVEAYRTIEKYLNQPDESLKEWAILAYQESKMLMESSLLDQAPLFISTGLGGKGKKLRYFIVVITRDKRPLSELHQKVIRSEFEFGFSGQGAELEDIDYYGYMATITGVVPLSVGLKDLLLGIVKQCNELGDFLSPSFMVTNVKKMSFEEIEKAILEYEEKKRNNRADENGIEN